MSFYDIDNEDGGLNRSASGARAPIQILPFLFIGNRATANAKKFLTRAKITTVINTTPASSDEPYESTLGDEYDVVAHPQPEQQEPSDDEAPESNYMVIYMTSMYDVLKNLKAENKMVLLVNDDLALLSSICAGYMLQSAKSTDKYLPLKKVLEYLTTKEQSLTPGPYLLYTALLEQILFEEVSIKLPSNSRKPNMGNKKPTGGQRRR